MVYVSLLLLLVLFMGVQFGLYRGLMGFQRVRRVRHRWLTSDLMRKTFLQSPVAGAFPEPREERLIVWHLGGLVLRVVRLSVALPIQCDARIDSIQAAEFDHCFSGEFKLHAHRLSAANAARPKLRLVHSQPRVVFGPVNS
jgi:hypothetical protein